MVAGGDDVSAEVEELFGERGRDAEAAGGVFAVDDEEVDGVGGDDVGEVLADDVAAGRAEDVADEENVHWVSLSRVAAGTAQTEGGGMIEMRSRTFLVMNLQSNYPAQCREQACGWKQLLHEAVDLYGDDGVRRAAANVSDGRVEVDRRWARRGWVDAGGADVFMTEGGHHGSLLALMASGAGGAGDCRGCGERIRGRCEQARAFRCPCGEVRCRCRVDGAGELARSVCARG